MKAAAREGQGAGAVLAVGSGRPRSRPYHSHISCAFALRVTFLDSEGWSQKDTLVLYLLVVISSLKIPKAVLIRS